MTAHEEWLAGRIDKSRAKAKETARTAQVREMAVATVNCFVMGLPEEDREPAMSAAARHLRTLYGAGQGEREAISLFASLSKTSDTDLGRAIARARVDQIARTMFRDAANENGGSDA